MILDRIQRSRRVSPRTTVHTSVGAGADGGGRPRLEIAAASRAFGDTQALDAVDLVAVGGEIHAIVGENGSGKSTLVKLIGGILGPDSGTIIIDGEPARHASPRRMSDRGVAVVYQEVLTVGSGTIVDNVFLGGDGLLRAGLDRATKAARTKEILERLSERPIDPYAEVEGQPLSVRQWITVARALVREPKILILDESTAALDLADAARLVTELERLKEDGVCVLLVTHRLAELQRLADRATVLRDGRSVGTLERGELNEQRLVELMTGEALETLHAVGEERRRTEPGRVTVRVADLQLREGAERFSADFRAGEVVGLAGLDGEGQAAFVRVLAGIEKAAAGAVVALGEDGSESEIASEKEASRSGIVYVPGDRKAEGILPNQTILENFGLPSYRDHSHAGLVSRRSVRRSLKEQAGPLRLDAGRAGDMITSLSGGNQQKVIIARWLARRPRVIVLNDPTRGVDMITKKDLYLTLRDLAAEGATVVFLSTEVEELTALCDRILIFRGQALAGELAEEPAPREVVAGMFGVRRAQEVDEVVAEAAGENIGPAEVRP